MRRFLIATKSDSKHGAPYAIACVTFGTEDKLKAAIAADEARVVVPNKKAVCDVGHIRR